MKFIEHPSPNHSARPAGTRVDTIIIHHTATSSDERGTRSAVGWLSQKDSEASAHYVVGHDGRVYRLVPEDRTAWHAGASCLPWEKMKKGASVNGRSIGIELVNPGDGVTPFTEAQYRALGEILPDLVRRHGWTSVQGWQAPNTLTSYVSVSGPEPVRGYILGHRDVAPGRKTDPADNFDWGRVREMLKARTS